MNLFRVFRMPSLSPFALIFVFVPRYWAAVQRPGIQCFVPGECLDSQILDTTISNTSRTCLQHCQSIQGCEWFTFYSDSKICTSLSGCLDLTEKKCGTNCISGEKECPELQCGIQGRCFGALEGIRKVGSVQECGSICANRVECKWHTHDPQHASCTMTNDCPALDKSCQECIASEMDCNAQDDTMALQGKRADSNSFTYWSYNSQSLIAFNMADQKSVQCRDGEHTFGENLPGSVLTMMNGTLYGVRETAQKEIAMEYFDTEQKKWLAQGTNFRWDSKEGLNENYATILADGAIFLLNPTGQNTILIDQNGPRNNIPTAKFILGREKVDHMCVTRVLGDDIFVSGGFETYLAKAGRTSRLQLRTLSDSFHLNTRTQEVSPLERLPGPRGRHKCASFQTEEGPKIFIFGGKTDFRQRDESHNYIYDWTSKTYMDLLEDYSRFSPVVPVPLGDTFLMLSLTGQTLAIYKFDFHNQENIVQFQGNVTLAEKNDLSNGYALPRTDMLPCVDKAKV